MNTLRAPGLRSFEQAKQWFQNTPPIRGHKDKVRPLGARRYHHRGSIDMPTDDQVVLKFYKAPFVTWKADNTFVVQHPAFMSAYCMDDLDGFLPPGMTMLWRECRPILHFHTKDGPRGYVLEDNDVFQFSVTGERTYELHNPKRVVKYTRRRGALAKLVNERYGAFLDWATVVSSVTKGIDSDESDVSMARLASEAGVPSNEDYKNFREKNERLYTSLNMWPDHRQSRMIPFPRMTRDSWFHTPSCEVIDSWLTGDPENWIHVLNVGGSRSGWFVWQARKFTLSMEMVHCFVNNIASHLFRNELFLEVELPDGEVPTRTNERYFTTRTFRDIPTDGRIVYEQ